MTLSDVEAVRLKTSDKSAITREAQVGDGVAQYFKLGHAPITSLLIWKNDLLQTVTINYTVDLVNAIVAFVVVPSIGDKLVFQFYWTVFSDDEVNYFLTEAGSNVTIASARLLLAWAADAAKVAKRQTLSGGGGLGQAVIDTSVVSKELRAQAKAYIELEQDLGESVPAEGLAEIPWTEFNYQNQLDQDLLRNA